MGLPQIKIAFQSAAATAVERGNRGIVALILEDTVPTQNPIVMNGIEDMPATLSQDSAEQIKLAFIGNETAPVQVIAYVIPVPAAGAVADYSSAETYLETMKWDYVAVPQIASADVVTFASWIKGLRDTKNIKAKAVLPNCAADYEGVINFATDSIKTSAKTYTAAQYCSRIAGLIAGTPLSISCTYAALPEVLDVPHHTVDEFNTMIDAGKLVLIPDNGSVKIGRGVNSLVTLTADKTADYQKIKVVDIMDLIYSDVKSALKEDYVGKYGNSYDEKLVVITVIQAYLESLEMDNLLDKGKSSVGIDIAAQKNYLKSIGTDVSKMTDQQVKEANTKDKVFLLGSCKILDAMEDFNLIFNM